MEVWGIATVYEEGKEIMNVEYRILNVEVFLGYVGIGRCDSKSTTSLPGLCLDLRLEI